MACILEVNGALQEDRAPLLYQTLEALIDIEEEGYGYTHHVIVLYPT